MRFQEKVEESIGKFKTLPRAAKVGLALLSVPPVIGVGCSMTALLSMNGGEFLSPNAVSYKRPINPTRTIIFVGGMAATPIKFHEQAQTVADYLAPHAPNSEFKFYRLDTWCPGENDASPQKIRDIAEGFSNHVWQDLDPTTKEVRDEISGEVKNQLKIGRSVTLLLFSQGAVLGASVINQLSDKERVNVSAVYMGADYGKVSQYIPWLNAKEPGVPCIRITHDNEVSGRLGERAHWFKSFFSEPTTRKKLEMAIAE